MRDGRRCPRPPPRASARFAPISSPTTPRALISLVNYEELPVLAPAVISAGVGETEPDAVGRCRATGSTTRPARGRTRPWSISVSTPGIRCRPSSSTTGFPGLEAHHGDPHVRATGVEGDHPLSPRAPHAPSRCTSGSWEGSKAYRRAPASFPRGTRRRNAAHSRRPRSACGSSQKARSRRATLTPDCSGSRPPSWREQRGFSAMSRSCSFCSRRRSSFSWAMETEAPIDQVRLQAEHRRAGPGRGGGIRVEVLDIDAVPAEDGGDRVHDPRGVQGHRLQEIRPCPLPPARARASGRHSMRRAEPPAERRQARGQGIQATARVPRRA